MAAPSARRTLNPVYRIWLNAKSTSPCHLPDDLRGSFDAFYALVGDRPSETARLVRIDKSLPFTEGNVYWKDGDVVIKPKSLEAMSMSDIDSNLSPRKKLKLLAERWQSSGPDWVELGKRVATPQAPKNTDVIDQKMAEYADGLLAVAKAKVLATPDLSQEEIYDQIQALFVYYHGAFLETPEALEYREHLEKVWGSSR